MQTAVVQRAVHGFPMLLLCFQHGSYMKANVVSCLYCISPSPHLKPCKTGNESKVIKRGFKDDNTVKLQIAPKYLSKTFLEIMQTPAQLSTQPQLLPSNRATLSKQLTCSATFYTSSLLPSLSCISPQAALLLQGSLSAPVAGEQSEAFARNDTKSL